MAGHMDADYQSIDKFCKSCSLSPATVRRLIKKGRLRFIQPGGKHSKILIPVANPFVDQRSDDGTSAMNEPEKRRTSRRGPRPQWK